VLTGAGHGGSEIGATVALTEGLEGISGELCFSVLMGKEEREAWCGSNSSLAGSAWHRRKWHDSTADRRARVWFK
jgi:hypothetical protein